MTRKTLKAEASKRLAEVRLRVEEANKRATEEKKLCNRTAFAIDYLYKLKDMANLIKALNDLGITYLIVLYSLVHTLIYVSYSGAATFVLTT